MGSGASGPSGSRAEPWPSFLLKILSSRRRAHIRRCDLAAAHRTLAAHHVPGAWGRGAIYHARPRRRPRAARRGRHRFDRAASRRCARRLHHGLVRAAGFLCRHVARPDAIGTDFRAESRHPVGHPRHRPRDRRGRRRRPRRAGSSACRRRCRSPGNPADQHFVAAASGRTGAGQQRAASRAGPARQGRDPFACAKTAAPRGDYHHRYRTTVVPVHRPRRRAGAGSRALRPPGRCDPDHDGRGQAARRSATRAPPVWRPPWCLARPR